MDIDFKLNQPPFNSSLIDELVALGAVVFGRSDAGYVTWRLPRMPDVSLFCATADGLLVGFKVGYAFTERKYYSWLGGVHPDFRRRGIASELMVRQHQWLAQRGYSIVETAVDQDNLAMAQANLRHCFSVCGMRTEPQRIQILYSKVLSLGHDRWLTVRSTNVVRNGKECVRRSKEIDVADLKAKLLAELAKIDGVEDRPSPVSGGSALFYHNKPFAHFHNANELDLRLTKKVIQALGLAHPADSFHHPNRSPSSQWIEIRFNSSREIGKVVDLVRLAVAEL